MKNQMPEASPVITVVIPTFNRAELLKQTLDSVLCQTYLNWEAVVVDDGSSDGTTDLLANYQRRDSRIRGMTRGQLPKGASACRNIGLAAAQGEYVVFLDSDDLLGATCLAERASTVQQNPNADFIAFQGLIFHEKPNDSRLIWNTENEESDLVRFLRGDAVWNMNGPIWKTASIKKLGGFDEQLGCWQDVDIHLRALIQGLVYIKRLDTVPDHFVRRHRMSSMSQNGFKSRETIGSILKVYEKTTKALASSISTEVKTGQLYMLAHAVQYALDNRYFDLAANGILLGRRDRLLNMQRLVVWNLAYGCYVVHSKGFRGFARIGKRLMGSFQPKFMAGTQKLPGR